MTHNAGRDASASADDDKRLAFVYQEAVRGLQHQQYVVESLNTRGGNLIFATAFATSLLGTRALSDGVGLLDWIAVCLLFLVGALIVFAAVLDRPAARDPGMAGFDRGRLRAGPDHRLVMEGRR